METKSGDWWDDIQYFSRNDPYIACSCGKCGGFPAEAAQNKLDVFYAVDRLNEDEYTELTALVVSIYGSEAE